MSTSEQPRGAVLADSATKLSAEARGAVIVTGSHGGRYAAYLTLSALPRAVIHNDAGVGKDEAGIAVIAIAEALGIPAATASHASCRIGDAEDTAQRGVISYANALSGALGVCPGMPCREAIVRLLSAEPSNRYPEPCGEARRIIDNHANKRIVLVDSASLIDAADARQIVVTASHGGLVGGDTKMALKADAFAAVFNDAGVGMEGAGIRRLPALDARGIAGLTVSAASARIGDAGSAFSEGIISYVNATATRLGACPGEPLRSRLLAWITLP
jgi:hypothetical protein